VIFAISHDHPERARLMAAELGPDITVLSDPSMTAIFRYGMKGQDMVMADMGYVLIDAAGLRRVYRRDRAVGDHAEELVEALRQITMNHQWRAEPI